MRHIGFSFLDTVNFRSASKVYWNKLKLIGSAIANVPNTFSVGIGHLNNRNLTFRCVPNKDGILVFLESVTDSEVVSSVTSPKTRNGYYAEIRQTGLIKMRSKSHNLRLRNSPLEME